MMSAILEWRACMRGLHDDSPVYAGKVAQNPSQPVLYQTARVTLRRMTAEDQTEFIELAKASIELHRPWITLPETPEEFGNYLNHYETTDGESTLICARETGAIAGFVTINDVIRGPYLRATVGYGAFAPSQRRGYMSEGFGLVFRFAFHDLGLHRLEADIQPGNKASVTFAKSAGFRYEGFSPGFIRIDGSWKDHERWAITSDMAQRAGQDS
jgi:[ribosomal protein S5]-alanine N-acetyltransferase